MQYNLSRLTREAFGDAKAECIELFGGMTDIQSFIIAWENVQEPPADPEEGHGIAEPSGSVNELPTDLWNIQVPVTEKSDSLIDFSWRWEWFAQIQWDALIYLQKWALILAICVFGLIVRKLIKYVFEFMYDVFNAKRIVYLKVILPRGDSKADRERQKELAKDMKEKIWRMGQVYKSMHKLWELGFREGIMDMIFSKPKFTLWYMYEWGQLSFMVAMYPEYQKIMEWALSAQYSDVSMEEIETPNYYSKKYSDILALEPKKDPIYPIRIFKQLEDDPMNNLIDAMAKVSPEDDFYILFNAKPVGSRYNKKAKERATWLYRNDKKYVSPDPRYTSRFSAPWRLVRFLTWGGESDGPQSETALKDGGQNMVRMIKSQEDSINTMGEEAATQAFISSFLLISGSNESAQRSESNILNVVASCSVFTDEYNNEFDKNDWKADVFQFFFKPMWIFASKFCLPYFFFQRNIFSTNEMATLFHLPDSIFNRTPVIRRLDYKMIWPPDNLPKLKQVNEGYVITWIVAEWYKKWNVSKILAEIKHEDVVHHKWVIEDKELVEADYVAKEWEVLTVTDDGKTLVTRTKKDHRYGLQCYKDGILLGINVYRNRYTPVYMKRDDRTRHHYIIGKSGTGKSVYISAIARQDIRAWDGVCVVDPHGDLVEEVLEYVPKSRAKDIIYFDAWDEARPMGLNLYEIHHVAEADRAVNDAVEMFIKMFGPEIFGPRIQEYFKYGSLTLLEDIEEWATLIDVPRLFTDDAYREYKTWRVKNPVVRNFREKTYNAMGDREKQEIIPYFTSKFVSFITNSLIRNIIGQTKSWFNFEDVMNNQKILLINLSKGKIWQLNAQLLGMIIVSKIYNGAMARQKIAKKDRKDFYLYVDEFQNFITDTFADILSEARKYRLNLIMAHQFIAQLDGTWAEKSQVKDAVFGNVWTMQSFKVGAPDAEFLEKEYQPVLSAPDILGISNYKAYIKLNINNTTTRPFSLDSIYTTEYRSKKVWAILKEYSAKKYGRKKEFVDAEIAARLWIMEDEEEEAPPEGGPWVPGMPPWMEWLATGDMGAMMGGGDGW